ncbi:MAG: nuclear transport factor 2 family protein [Proteobacteria bacterium]|nr:nuclear transport factor 2 family protein [Pseudomonadota bacterium]
MSPLRRIALCLIAASLLLCSACSRSGNARAEIQTRYDAMNAALKSKDADKFLAVLTPDFEQVGADKTSIKRAKMDEIARALVKETEQIDSTSTIEQVTVTGDRADVTVVTKQKVTVKNPVGDKSSVVEITSTSQDVWKNDKGEWKLLNSAETKHEALKDGQPLATPTTRKRD